LGDFKGSFIDDLPGGLRHLGPPSFRRQGPGTLRAPMVSSCGGYVFCDLMLSVCMLAPSCFLGAILHLFAVLIVYFFIVGTAGAVHVPCVAWTPFRSLEQIGPLAVFVLFQLVEGDQFLRDFGGFGTIFGVV